MVTTGGNASMTMKMIKTDCTRKALLFSLVLLAGCAADGHNNGAVVGSAAGGAAGAAVGYDMGGRDGAVVGGAIGAAVGAAIGGQQDAGNQVPPVSARDRRDVRHENGGDEEHDRRRKHRRDDEEDD